MPRSVTALLIALLALLAACGDSQPAPAVPRRPAYPRPALYPQQYAMPEFPVRFPTNAAATVTTERASGSHWLTVDYPRYGASLYVTATPVANGSALRAEVDNRLRRMELNAGSVPVDETDGLTSGGHWTMTRARGASATPLQFIIYPAADRGWVVSGAVFLKGQIAPSDSLAPIINALAADLRYALDHYAED